MKLSDSYLFIYFDHRLSQRPLKFTQFVMTTSTEFNGLKCRDISTPRPKVRFGECAVINDYMVSFSILKKQSRSSKISDDLEFNAHCRYKVDCTTFELTVIVYL
jgi:hypothetical protein